MDVRKIESIQPKDLPKRYEQISKINEVQQAQEEIKEIDEYLKNTEIAAANQIIKERREKKQQDKKHLKNKIKNLPNKKPFNHKIKYDPAIGACELWGKRVTQEDRIDAGILSKFSSKEIVTLTNQDWDDILKKTVSQLQENIESAIKAGSIENHGSCLCANIVVNGKIHTVNVGDSTSYLIGINNQKKVIRAELLNNLPNDINLSDRKKRQNSRFLQEEAERLDAKKTEINKKINDHKLNGKKGKLPGTGVGFFGAVFQNRLSVTRALGDIGAFGISHEPEIIHTDISKNGHSFLVTACDGLTEKYDPDALETKEAIGNTIIDTLANKPQATPEDISVSLATEGFTSESEDNISVIVTDLTKLKDNQVYFSAVFDGHAGDHVSHFLYQNFSKTLQAELKLKIEEKNKAGFVNGNKSSNLIDSDDENSSAKQVEYPDLDVENNNNFSQDEITFSGGTGTTEEGNYLAALKELKDAITGAETGFIPKDKKEKEADQSQVEKDEDLMVPDLDEWVDRSASSEIAYTDTSTSSQSSERSSEKEKSVEQIESNKSRDQSKKPGKNILQQAGELLKRETEKVIKSENFNKEKDLPRLTQYLNDAAGLIREASRQKNSDSNLIKKDYFAANKKNMDAVRKLNRPWGKIMGGLIACVIAAGLITAAVVLLPPLGIVAIPLAAKAVVLGCGVLAGAGTLGLTSMSIFTVNAFNQKSDLEMAMKKVGREANNFPKK